LLLRSFGGQPALIAKTAGERGVGACEISAD